jgi:hypothetical protein
MHINMYWSDNVFTIMEYTFGADKVFKWALYSMPFLLVWCLLTEKNPLIWVLLGNVHICVY